MFEGVRQGTGVGADDWMLPLDRHGYLEERYFTFSYSPIRDESGGVGGILVTVTETTGRVLGERRLRTLRDLAASAGQIQREEDAWRGAAAALEAAALDVPFALIYRIDRRAGEPAAPPRLAAWAGGAPARRRPSRAPRRPRRAPRRLRIGRRRRAPCRPRRGRSPRPPRIAGPSWWPTRRTGSPSCRAGRGPSRRTPRW